MTFPVAECCPPARQTTPKCRISFPIWLANAKFVKGPKHKIPNSFEIYRLLSAKNFAA